VPASMRASGDSGGVLISPPSHTSGFASAIHHGMSVLTYNQDPGPSSDQAAPQPLVNRPALLLRRPRRP
jgi:hypothetical protein